MLSKHTKYLVFICILGIPLLTTLIGNSSGMEPPKTSSVFAHKIYICGNSKLDAFVAGNGTTGLTPESAHIIENFSIHTNTNDYGIFIQDIDRYLIIRNCAIYASENAFSEKTGIEIRLSSNILIENCTITYHTIGIQLLDSYFSTVKNSEIVSNNKAGIRLLEADHNNVINNMIKNNLGYGIHLKRAHENTVINNTIEDNQDLGIYDKGDNNIFENNTCEPSTKLSIMNKTWLWVILGVGAAVFFIGGLMFFITWRGR